MKRLIWIVAGVPVAIVIIVLAVVNRQTVSLNLDPLSPTDPFIALTGPFFVFLFAATAIGILVGGLTTWTSQRKWRRLAKQRRADAIHLRREVRLAHAARPPADGGTLPAPRNRAA